MAHGMGPRRQNHLIPAGERVPLGCIFTECIRNMKIVTSVVTVKANNGVVYFSVYAAQRNDTLNS